MMMAKNGEKVVQMDTNNGFETLAQEPSYEEHMRRDVEHLNKAQYDENKQNLQSIDEITRSRARDVLRKGVDERMDAIELAKANGQFISEEDWKFAMRHGGGPYQRTGGGDFRRIDLMRTKESNHFKTAQYIEKQKHAAIDKQNQVEELVQSRLDTLDDYLRAGGDSNDKIHEIVDQVDALKQLSSTLPKVDTDIRQPYLRSDEEIAANQNSIKHFEKELKRQDSEYENEIEQSNPTPPTKELA